MKKVKILHCGDLHFDTQFKDLNKKYKKTIFMVIHDPFVASYSDRLVYLKDGKIAFEAFKKNRELE